MATFIVVGFTIVTIAIINILMEKVLDNKVKQSKNFELDNTVFTYATWAKWLEGLGLSLFVLLVLVLFYLSEDTWEYNLYLTLLILLILSIIYRSRSWRKEKLYFNEKELIYSRGRFKKKVTTIELNNVSYVEVRLLTFDVHMKDNKSIKIPACFTNLSKVYGILKYHRHKDEK